MSIHTDRISTGFIRFLIPAVLLLILLPACSPRTSGEQLPEGTEMCMPGDNVVMDVELITPIAIEEGLRFAIREGGRTVGSGVVTAING